MKNWAADRITFDQGRAEATAYLEAKGYHFVKHMADAFISEKWQNDSGSSAYLRLCAHGVYHLQGCDL